MSNRASNLAIVLGLISRQCSLNRTKNRIGWSINHNFKHRGRSVFYVSFWIQIWPADSTCSCCSHINALHYLIENVKIGLSLQQYQVFWGMFLIRCYQVIPWGFAICAFVHFGFFCLLLFSQCSLQWHIDLTCLRVLT